MGLEWRLLFEGSWFSNHDLRVAGTSNTNNLQ